MEVLRRRSQLNKLIYLGISLLFLFTVLVTPLEAKYLEQDYNWMLLLNLKEMLIFAFSLIIGIKIGEVQK